MSYLVVVAPLKPGAAAAARKLLAEGPPFELEASAFVRHSVHLDDHEVVFVFETEGSHATLTLPAEDVRVWRAAEAWIACLAERPRVARAVFSWQRTAGDPGVSFDPTPGPGDSEGGDIYKPSAA